jgi:hypothetical protein
MGRRLRPLRVRYASMGGAMTDPVGLGLGLIILACGFWLGWTMGGRRQAVTDIPWNQRTWSHAPDCPYKYRGYVQSSCYWCWLTGGDDDEGTDPEAA